MKRIHPFGRLKPAFEGTALIAVIALAVLASIRSSNAELPPPKVRVGDKAPDFTLPSAEGRAVKVSDFAGHNVLIDFYRGYW